VPKSTQEICSLADAYERVLKEIKKPNQDHARRLLQCLVVAIHPLNVKELAEVLAVDFDDADGIPKLKTNWRWEDEEQALLSSCSSLITIVEAEDSWVVQFSHFSVKEYLTSARLVTSNADVLRYHIDLEAAHIILAQACMGVLLQSDNGVEESGAAEKMSPLAEYAAEHWVTHAQFERVSSFLRKAMEHLFDLDMPYFVAWVQLYDIDTPPNRESSSLHELAVYSKSSVTPIYVAALCGFQDLVEHLVVKYPQHVNAIGGHYVTPLIAALAGRHFQTAKFLYHKGAHMDIHGNSGDTALCSAAWYGDLEMVQVLLDLEADVNDRGINNWTPIYNASQGPYPRFSPQSFNNPQLLPDVARLLLERGADVNARIEHGSDDNLEGRTPLHTAANHGRVEVARVLLEYGANVGAEDNKGRTPLHDAADYRWIEANSERAEDYASGKVEVVRVLLEHGANLGAKDNEGKSPLHKAAEYGNVEGVRVLLRHGANVGAEDNKGRTPLHDAADYGTINKYFGKMEDYVSGKVDVVRMLLEHGANVGAEDNKGRTPLHDAADYRRAEANSERMEDYANGKVEAIRVLLEHGANAGAEDNAGRTALHIAEKYGEIEVVHVLLEHGANVGAEDSKGRTPFRMASASGEDETMKLLLEYGAEGYTLSSSSLCLPD
jgi:ankyrin repeat protein